MKRRTACLDDVHNELEFVLGEDGRRIAKLVLWLSRVFYRFHRAALLLTLRRKWRPPQFDYPPPGREPFNLTDAELERELERPGA